MPRLALALLGPFEATLDGRTLPGFPSDNTRGLLAYLAVEANRPHTRSRLAGLLWPERSEAAALGNLRRTLADLRRVLRDREAARPFLLVSRESIQFNHAADSQVDVRTFRDSIAAAGGQDIAALERAVTLYRGSFLEGFAGHASTALEEWIAFTRDQLAGEIQAALGALTALHEGRGDEVRAETTLRRRLALEPWREGIHRDLMHLLARCGQRGAALVQYEVCRQALQSELAVDPSRETIALYERIRDGGYTARSFGPAMPPIVSPATREEPGDRDTGTVCVARERQLAWLHARLAEVLDGGGRVAFVVGDAGSGKTALLSELTQQAMERHAEVVVAGGSCNAYAGAGDPYLPFREILELLAGDLEAKRAGGSVSPEQARRLWDLFPVMLRALLDAGPNLIDTFVPGAGLLERGQSFGPADAAAVTDLEHLLQRGQRSSISGARQPDLFEQVTRVLERIAHRQALILVLDDLQWADRGSISLLFHLGRRLAGSRILLLGAYRPDEVAQGREGERHPLAAVVDELQRDFGDIVVDLEEAGGRAFVDALLDNYPNRLGPEFRERLTHHTGGHALFTVELLRGLQKRGDLIRDGQGHWAEGPNLDWDALPARVEAVIAEHLARLPAHLQGTLRVASVEGEEFTAEVIARVQGRDDREIVRQLSGPLAREYRLVRAQSLQRLNGHSRSRYRFRHFLFQSYLYRHLDEIERAQRHEAVGAALEELYDERAAATAPQLARHFEEAGLTARAALHLMRAGNRALELQAHQESIAHFRRGLTLLKTLAESAERDRLERDLQLALGSALYATEGLGGAEKIEAYSRAYHLSRRLGPSAELWPALQALASASTAHGDHARALELSEELLEVVQHSGDPAQLALGHFTLGERLFAGGDLLGAREHLEQAIEHYQHVTDPTQRRLLTDLKGFDLGVNARAWLAMTLWMLGYPDGARQCSQEALAHARQLDHLLSLVLGLYAVSQIHYSRVEDRELQVYVQELAGLMSTHHMLVGDVWVDIFTGWLEVRDCHVADGLARMARGKAAWEATGAVFGSIAQSITLTEAYLEAGRPGDGVPVIAHAISVMERAGLRTDEAELHRLRGELLLCDGGADESREAEECFRHALEIARRQQARSWELRAATSLAHLWRLHGRDQEAYALLAPIYAWFTEGFETSDLRASRILLAELSSSTTPMLAPA